MLDECINEWKIDGGHGIEERATEGHMVVDETSQRRSLRRRRGRRLLLLIGRWLVLLILLLRLLVLVVTGGVVLVQRIAIAVRRVASGGRRLVAARLARAWGVVIIPGINIVGIRHGLKIQIKNRDSGNDRSLSGLRWCTCWSVEGLDKSD